MLLYIFGCETWTRVGGGWFWNTSGSAGVIRAGDVGAVDAGAGENPP